MSDDKHHPHGGRPGHHHFKGHKFDPARLEKLRDPERLLTLPPDLIWETTGAHRDAVVVDLGCGPGYFALPFAKKALRGWVYACDILPVMLEYIRRASADEGAANITPVLCGEAHVPLPDGLADLVFMANMHHEFDDPQRALRESRRLLRPGGRLAALDWKPEETPHGPPLEVRFHPGDVADQLRAAGFSGVAEHDILPHNWFLTATC
ncbi:MAG: class I SAM-dependent methyltransferase [Deltaproteobacteria bacterium]|nr:class I SAM-dependent methyltransferase [Deltaproteobacteria bacterium]